jgi:carbon storage regulator
MFRNKGDVMPNLVLTRSLKQKLMIGQDGEIVVTVLGVRGGQVRLSIQAPEGVPVDREEIYEKRKAEKK